MYRLISEDLDQLRSEREVVIEQAIKDLQDLFEIAEIDATITGRPKHLFGLYQKHKKTGVPVNQINDALATRIIVSTKEECYEALRSLFIFFPSYRRHIRE